MSTASGTDSERQRSFGLPANCVTLRVGHVWEDGLPDGYPAKTTTRVGREWEDGLPAATRDFLPYQKFKTIPLAELSKSHLPPLFHKLEDEQVGHLLAAIEAGSIVLHEEESIANELLRSYWVGDFLSNGKLRGDREHFGKRYEGSSIGEAKLNGQDLEGETKESHRSKLLRTCPKDKYSRNFFSNYKVMVNDPEFIRRIGEEQCPVGELPRSFLSAGRVMVADPEYIQRRQREHGRVLAEKFKKLRKLIEDAEAKAEVVEVELCEVYGVTMDGLKDKFPDLFNLST